jgi:hypothetical protein
MHRARSNLLFLDVQDRLASMINPYEDTPAQLSKIKILTP